MNTNLSIIPIIASLTILYIFLTKYGYKENKNLIKLSLYTNIGSSILLVIMNFYIPAITETISINMEGTFEYNYKILIIYPLIVLISQYIVVNLYKLTVYDRKDSLKLNSVIADEVIDGLWGNGEDRKNNLTKTGYNYKAIQAVVNEKLKKR